MGRSEPQVLFRFICFGGKPMVRLQPLSRARIAKRKKPIHSREIPREEADGIPTPGPTPAPQGEGFNRPQEIPPEARDGLDGERGLGVSHSSISSL